MNLGMFFLPEYYLKMICLEEEVALRPVKDGSTSRVRLVDRGCHRFLSKKSGKVLQATKDQIISTQVWRIPREKISVNMLQERPAEVVGVYAKDDCSIRIGTGTYIPVQTGREIAGEVLIKTSDKTVPRLV